MASCMWTNWQLFEVLCPIPGRFTHLGPRAYLGPAHEGTNNHRAWALSPALHPGAPGSLDTARCSQGEGGRARWDTCLWTAAGAFLDPAGRGEGQRGPAHSCDVGEVFPGGFASGRGGNEWLGRQATAGRACCRNTLWSPEEGARHHLSYSPVERRGEGWDTLQWGGGGGPGRQGRVFVRLQTAQLGPVLPTTLEARGNVVNNPVSQCGPGRGHTAAQWDAGT